MVLRILNGMEILLNMIMIGNVDVFMDINKKFQMRQWVIFK